MAKPATDYAKIVAKAWADESYRQRLIEDPHQVLAEEGWDVDPSTTFQVKPDADTHMVFLALPKRPEGLKDDQLDDAADATPCSSRFMPCSC